MEEKENNTVTVIKTIGKSIVAAIPGLLVAVGSLLLANVAIDKNNKR